MNHAPLDHIAERLDRAIERGEITEQEAREEYRGAREEAAYGRMREGIEEWWNVEE
jgi:hypothetical protein